ncbi:MAG: HDOD domain-containing protein [Candidatus Kapabacteria bacterium]|nr:HDOD domain-containing protein [Candidatus Kapabacteria bacterium]
MLDRKIKLKLETLTDLPTIPFVLTEVLHALDDTEMRASHLAGLIQRDQTLTARVLKVANSPFYGFARRISTIDLAIVLLGTNTIKEIVIGLVLQKFISKSRRSTLDTKAFWEYSVFCGAAARVLARKLKYRLAGEAFVAGLMHDIGILIMSEFFSKEFRQVRSFQERFGKYMLDAEIMAFRCTHSDIGSWFAERWYLPRQLCESIRYHHDSYTEMRENKKKEDENRKDNRIFNSNDKKQKKEPETDEHLISIVAMAEWFALECGFKKWTYDQRQPPLFLANEILETLGEHEILSKESAIDILKTEIMEEYEKAAAFTEIATRPVYSSSL